jgi:hypothetical protein
MPTDPAPSEKSDAADQRSAEKPLTPAAERALAEAAARRGTAKPDSCDPATETGGRGGLEPTRYGDWEVNGLTSDF